MYVANFPTPTQRVIEYEKLGYGMFLHYGLYSELGRGEWVYHMEKHDMKEYEKLAEKFTAKDFDAEKIVLAAKSVGCKYVNLTTRHHDGFALYDTKGMSTFDSLHAPNCGRDLVREFVDACHKHDMVPFLYHTTIDWHEKSFYDDFDNEYLEYLRKSVEILCTNYGKIGGFFFDGNWWHPKKDWKLDELYGTIRKHQPDAIIINNTGLNNLGKAIHPEIDAVTFEQNGVREPIDRDGRPFYFAGETCMTLNTHWGIAHKDFNYKSPADVIRTLAGCRAAGVNYLLNLSPTADGALPEFQIATLGVVKDWIDIHKDIVYDCEPLYYPRNPKTCANCSVVINRDGKSIYFIMFDNNKIGDANVTVGGMYSGIVGFSNVQFDIEKVEWMDSGEELKFYQPGDNTLMINFTGQPYGTDVCVRVAKATLK